MTDQDTPSTPSSSTPEETPSQPASAETAATATTEPAPVPRPSGSPPDGHWWWGTGRRKAAVARVRIRPGKGAFVVNNRQMQELFTEERDHNDINAVLGATNTKGTIDVYVNVNGGGFTGQAGAIKLGLARALRRYDQSLEPILRDNDFLTRDPRKVERKKYGQPGARKRFQFSKR